MSDAKSDALNLPDVRGIYKFEEPLSHYTWLNVGGPAEVMYFPEDIADLQYFLKNKPTDLNVFILGGGANILVKDSGIKGAVVKLANKNFSDIRLKNNMLICGAGMLNFRLKDIVIEQGLGGLEFLCSIPGCIGGALRSNAGCFGREISDVLYSARVIDGQGNIFTVNNDDFHFSYRHSEFPADWIILEVSLKYDKKDKMQVKTLIEEQAEYRRTHQPQGIRTAGSTFKNPPNMRAWELIKNSGADKLKYGGAMMSPQHCNFLQNDGTASAADIEKLCSEIVKKVENDCGVHLEMEVQTIGGR